MLANFEQVMEFAAQESERLNHPYLGTEHALLGLLRASNASAVSVLRSHGLTAEAVEAELGRLEEPRDAPALVAAQSYGLAVGEARAR
jgi:ATP-dependent Clp protease ATP-binding subunit ClpC